MKRIFAIIFVTIMLFTLVPLSAFNTYATSGSCGNDATWTYSGGTLTISGTGKMRNYTNTSRAPWSEYDITNIVIEYGITSIGECAFIWLLDLQSIEIADSVTVIDELAFQNSNLPSIVIPDSVTRINYGAFAGCDELADITIGNSVEYIGSKAFQGCNSLTTVYIPKSVTKISELAFSSCRYITTFNCEASSQPAGWEQNWYTDCTPTINWGVRTETKAEKALSAAIDYANSLNEYDYTAEEWLVIQNAIAEAESFDTTDKTENEINAVTNKLYNIIANPSIPNYEIVVGDINGNGKIDARDYLLLKRAYFGTYTLDCGLEIADINGNGKLDARDYLLLKRMYFGTYTIQ